MKPKNFPARVQKRRLEAATRLMNHVRLLKEAVPNLDTSRREAIIFNTLQAVKNSGTRASRSKKNREERVQ